MTSNPTTEEEQQQQQQQQQLLLLLLALSQHHHDTIKAKIEPPSSQLTFKSNYKSVTETNASATLMTTQHSLTLENYSKIKSSPLYLEPKFSPPPLMYGKDKRLLVEIVKIFGLKHGYRVVLNKNDSRRVILLCAKHGTNTSKKNGGANGLKSKAKKGSEESESSLTTSFMSGNKTHKCQCPFRAEIQLKQRLRVWVVKPIHMEHNHDDDLARLPFNVDNSTLSNLPSETTHGGHINTKYKITDLCTASNHLTCLWDHGYLHDLLGIDESLTEEHISDGVPLINVELINNNTIKPGVSKAATTTADGSSSKRRSQYAFDSKILPSQDSAKKQQQTKGNISTHDSLIYLSAELSRLFAIAKEQYSTANQFYVKIKNINPENFFDRFPAFEKFKQEIDFKLENLEEGGDLTYYNVQLVYGDTEWNVLLNDDIIDMNKEINDMISVELIKKFTQTLATELNKLAASSDKQDKKPPAAESAIEEVPDIANITAVAMKAQQGLIKEDQTEEDPALLVDPDLTK